MIRGRAIRTFLAVLLVLTQSAAGGFAAQAAAQGGPCVLHVALVSGAGHASAHSAHDHSSAAGEHVHNGGHEPENADQDDHPASHFSNACCLACTVAVTASDTTLRMPEWLRSRAIPAARGLEPGELTSTDPPPRILL